jgi:hypothetical protein
MDWRLRFNDGYNREVVRTHATQEEAFMDACSLRRTHIDLSIEGPDWYPV